MFIPYRPDGDQIGKNHKYGVGATVYFYLNGEMLEGRITEITWDGPYYRSDGGSVYWAGYNVQTQHGMKHASGMTTWMDRKTAIEETEKLNDSLRVGAAPSVG